MALDAASGSVRRRIALGRTPSAIAGRDGVVWLVDADAPTVLRLSEGRARSSRSRPGRPPPTLRPGLDRGVGRERADRWQARSSSARSRRSCRADSTPPPAPGAQNVPLPGRGGRVSNLVENHLAVEQGAVWAVAPTSPSRGSSPRPARSPPVRRAVRAAAVAAGGRRASGCSALTAHVVRLDARGAAGRARASGPDVAGGVDRGRARTPPGSLARQTGRCGGSAAGAADARRRRCRRGASPTRGRAGRGLGRQPVAGTSSKVGTRLPRASERTVHLGGIPRSIARRAAARSGSPVVDAIRGPTDEVGGHHSFPARRASRVAAGSGEADVLVVSDLPLQGGIRVSARRWRRRSRSCCASAVSAPGASASPTSRATTRSRAPACSTRRSARRTRARYAANARRRRA